jgi:hypothetical protein
MNIYDQIQEYIDYLPDSYRQDMQLLHQSILDLMPAHNLWFIDGKNEQGKMISAPRIGYGSFLKKHKDGTATELYQIGLSVNAKGMSVYIMDPKKYPFSTSLFGDKIGAALIQSNYIRFKSLEHIDLNVLFEAVRYGLGYNK